MKTSIIPIAITVAVLTCFISTASGALVATLLDEESDIINTGGALISAANFGEAAVSVNGIAHAAGSGGAANLILGAGGTFEGDFRNGQSGIGGNVEILLSGILGYTGGANIVFDITGLNIGTTYLFQAYWEGWPGEEISFTAESDTIGITDQNPATLISYDFTATDTVLNIIIDKTSTGSPSDGNAWISGYSLQEIPEPSSTVFLVLGGLALTRRSR